MLQYQEILFSLIDMLLLTSLVKLKIKESKKQFQVDEIIISS